MFLLSHWTFKQDIIAGGDAQTIISHLMERQNRDSDFFLKYMTDGEGHLQGLFWCDTQCLLDYKAFGDVVVLIAPTKKIGTTCPLCLSLG